MSKVRQFVLLLWKNFLLQRRKIITTILEIALPLFFAIILIFIRQLVVPKPVKNPIKWDRFEVDKFPIGLCPSPFLPCRWLLYYAPNSSATDDIMSSVKEHLQSHITGIKGFATEDDMISKIMDEYEKSQVIIPGVLNSNILGGVVFTHVHQHNGSQYSFPQNIEYKIRLASSGRRQGVYDFQSALSSDSSSWHTRFLFPMMPNGTGPREPDDRYGGGPGYYREGFLSLQNAINWGIINSLIPKNLVLPELKVDLKRFPYPPYNDDPFVVAIQKQLPLFIMLSFIVYALSIVKELVHEKERKLKESMKMMGLSNWLHWTAWFVKYLLMMIVSTSIMTLCFCINIGEYGHVVGHTHPSVVFVFLLLYAISTINFCFAISVFFKRANTAAAAGGALFFISYIPYSFLQPRYDTLSYSAKMVSSVLPNIAMSFGAQIIGMYEGLGSGVQWANINEPISIDDNFTMLQVFIMFIVDAVLYAIIAWYVETVYPGEYGVPQPFYFPVLKSYWCGMTYENNDYVPLVNDFANESSSSSFSDSTSSYFEKEPHGLRAGISIINLRKVFGKKQQKKVAVAGMTLNMYEGQITALLGHNGAGKTTTMSMLTGFIPPTSGTATVNGCDIKTNIDGVRRSLGLCPQHDILFDTLTVDEHLVFFAMLKGLPRSEVAEEVDRIVEAIGLAHKRYAPAKSLSGGMKRKLSVGIALIAGSRIVILDEPTSGMDPEARRHTWNLLQKERDDRTMVLTTHFMDEADLLGDRIAIMNEGVVQCCGSSLFLKKKYGAGYHMVMVKNEDCKVTAVTDLIRSFVPSAELESNVGAELSYILPQESSEKFEKLFTQIEEQKGELGISSYGASVTTMEEVFLKVGESIDAGLKEKLQSSFSTKSGELLEPLFNVNIKKNTGFWLCVQQFSAMFLKRVIHTWRNWLVTSSQLIVPLFFTITALVVLRSLPMPEDSPPRSMAVENVGENTVLFSTGNCQTNETQLLAKFYTTQFSDRETTATNLNHEPDFTTNTSLETYLVRKAEESLNTYTKHYLIAAEFLQNDTKATHVRAHFNNQAYHTPAMTLEAIFNALVGYFVYPNYTITAVNHPLPRTSVEKMSDDTSFMKSIEGFTIAFNVMFGFAFLSSSFTLFLVKERSVKAKHSQFVSGVSMFNFWLSTFCWDLINYLMPCALLLAVFAGFNTEAYTSDGHLGYVFLLFILYGWAMLPLMYNLSFLFSIPSSAFVWLSMFNILSGIATLLAVDVLSIPVLQTLHVANVLEWIFMIILPNYDLGQGLQDLYNNYQYLNICKMPIVESVCKDKETVMPCCKGHCGDSCLPYQDNYLSWEASGIGRQLTFLGVQGLFYFTVLFVIESGILRILWYYLRRLRRRHQSPSRQGSIHSVVQEDDDVSQERMRVNTTPINLLVESESLVLTELSKKYGKLLAVDRLSVGIHRGECFGLLGTNGAGKTSTFKMLTGDETVTGGNAYLDGFDIQNNIKTVQRRLGYCPQFDALIDQMTGREMLYMYARLRGVCEDQLFGVVNELVYALLLEDHIDKLVKSYSGGNKRKLSTAVALIGDPPVIFLDEPTTGMDPVARRLLWDTLCRIRASGRTLVLTSHSMEECEALCTKIAIMVNGQLKCLGSTQHLKNKFGEGFTLIAQVGPPSTGGTPDLQPLMNFIESRFPCSILKDIHQGMLHYHIVDQVSWAKLFGTMERAKEQFNIEDYSVSQTTLEQVFINFARSQIPPQEERRGLCKRCCGGIKSWCRCLCCRFCRHLQDDMDIISEDDDNDPVV